MAKLTEAAVDFPSTEAAKVAFVETIQTMKKAEDDRAADDASVYDWLVAVVDAITELGKKAKATVETHEETIKGLTDNKASDADMSALQSVQPEINAARERHTAAVGAEATALAAFSAELNSILDDCRPASVVTVFCHARISHTREYEASDFPVKLDCLESPSCA
jgi:hypothetical protein